MALTVLLLALTACSLINRDAGPTATLGHTTELTAAGVLVCSQPCAERGQCGDAVEGGEVILGGRGQPLTTQHDVFFPADVQVDILQRVPYTLRPLSEGDNFNLNFYNIAVPGGEQGWVAGWCLAAPE
jgi:hypothetical protein